MHRKTINLGRLSAAQFLRRYWQRRPLVLRQALPHFPVSLSPDELAGLACEREVFSRLIIEKGGTRPWEVRRGPFKARSFADLPRTHWTLLVNGVDRLLPEVNALFDYFSFLPSWRLDDIMISYAVKHGNVGAHVDNYDVFLVQASGKREWRFTEQAVLEDDFVPGLEIKLLRKFRPTKRYVLEPGDVLYLPPRIPHHGIALDNDCMTYSVGFRAPSAAEIVDSVATDAIGRMDEVRRYSDPALALRPSGELPPAAIKQVRAMLAESLLDPAQLTRWMGAFVTKTHEEFAPAQAAPPWRSVTRAAEAGAELVRTEGSRVCYSVVGGEAYLFANGEEFTLPARSRRWLRRLTAAVRAPLCPLVRLTSSSLERETLRRLLAEGIFRIEGSE